MEVPLAATVLQRPPDALLLRPVAIPGSVYLGIASIDPSGSEPATPGVGVHLEGLVHERTRFTFGLVHGYAELVSLLSLSARLGTTVRAELLHPKWRVIAGDFASPADALTGYFVQADGLSIRYSGTVAADLQVGRPKYLGGTAGGYLASARVGIRTPLLTLRAVGTMLSRPPATNIRVRLVENPVVDSEQDVADLRRLETLLPRSESLQSAGFEAEVRPRAGHGFVSRAGFLQATGSGQASGITAEARYSIVQPKRSFAASARHSPAGVLGFPLAGDAVNLNGTTSVGGRFKAMGHLHWSATPLVVAAQTVRSRGGTIGLEYSSNQRRVMVQARYAELDSARFARITRAISVNAALPAGWLRVNGNAEVGTATRNRGDELYRVLRVRVGLFDRGAVAFGISGTYDDTGDGAARVRGDADISWSRGDLLVEAGTGYAAGDLLGDSRHAWLNAEIPLGRRFILTSAVDYITWDHTSSAYLAFADLLRAQSPWRFSFGMRQPFLISVPFLRPIRDSRGRRP
jgi:hypothetical protein